MGRYIKGSCTKVRIFCFISWLGGSCQSNFQREIKVCRYIFVSEPVFSFKDFQRLVTYVVPVDSNLQEIKAGLGIANAKNGEKNIPSIGVGGPIKNQNKSTMKFTNYREINYKIVAALKK